MLAACRLAHFGFARGGLKVVPLQDVGFSAAGDGAIPLKPKDGLNGAPRFRVLSRVAYIQSRNLPAYFQGEDSLDFFAFSFILPRVRVTAEEGDQASTGST